MGQENLFSLYSNIITGVKEIQPRLRRIMEIRTEKSVQPWKYSVFAGFSFMHYKKEATTIFCYDKIGGCS